MPNDPVAMIKQDHRKVEDLFTEYEGLGSGAHNDARDIVDRIIKELTIHAEMEENICYPHCKETLDGEEEQRLIDESYKEHQNVKMILEELRTTEPAEEEFDAKMKVLMEEVRHHVTEEENELLPKMEVTMDDAERTSMADEMRTFKATHQSRTV